MFKNMLQLRSKVMQSNTVRQATQNLFLKQTPQRFFSSGPVSQGPGLGAMLGVGLGTAGLMYMVYQGRTLSQQRTLGYQGQQMSFFNPVVQDRIGKALAYFGGGVLITGCLVGALRASSLAYMNPWAMMALMFGTMIGTWITPYENTVLKHTLWMSYMTTIALSMVPLINMASMPIIFDAMFATGFTMGGLGLVAYNAPSEQFLMWGGMLGMGCAAMIGISIA